MEKEYENTFAGKLTDTKISTDIAEYQELFDNPDNVSKDSTEKSLTDDAYFKYFFPYMDYWKLINGNYVSPTTYDSSFSAIKNMDIENGMDFYADRDKKVDTLLNSVYVDWNFSDSEKDFWYNRISSIQIPYEYGYHEGWEKLLKCMELFIIGIVGICICVSGVFSGEYQSGADSIILSSRYGKSKLVTAKVLAAFAYSLLIFTLFILVGCGILLMAFGTDGWNLPVQVLSSIAPYSLSLSGAVLVSIATLYLVMLGMVSFTLLLSAKMKSSVPVLVIIILVMMLPMFLGISETSGIWNRILVLLPYRAVQPVFASDFYGYFGYPLGGLTFDIVTVRMVVYVVIAIICIPFARKAWKNHQVL
jgi:ABC-type transport system involved in multi-copper enzyme maturation permease subunit